ncbi:helix-turn-helix domain-containing protein [Halomonas sp. ATCH28]|uniref:Helix-turn-helix domain-containing protein n=1 Tax=Halomonas gemina TaxID=2945105 RepID=A0ABT0T5N5_9GAMM|nr:helix-turn-helix transcriptional regulator [Halomonas gemina]MCL7942241.1 helix-turn-helix domain-containing protein [Halomonas gemina]
MNELSRTYIDNLEAIRITANTVSYHGSLASNKQAYDKTNLVRKVCHSVVEENIICISISDLARRMGVSRQYIHQVLQNKDIFHVEKDSRFEYLIYVHPLFYFVGTEEQQKEALIEWYKMNTYREGFQPFSDTKFIKAWYEQYPSGNAFKYTL